MSYFSTKTVLIVVLSLAIIALGFYILLPKPGNPLPPLPIQQTTSSSPSPAGYHRKPPVAPLPSFSPPAIPYEQLTQQQKEQYQSQADAYYQKTQDTILKNYPWYLKLPIEGTNYFVYFDPASETFIAKLYPQKSSTVSLDEQTNSLKKVVVAKINEFGTDAGSYKVEWKVIPE